MKGTCTRVSQLLHTRNTAFSRSKRVRVCASASGLLLGCAAYIKQLSDPIYILLNPIRIVKPLELATAT